MAIEIWGWPVLLGVLGLVFGSFIATLAIRWPEGRAVSKGRSACDACGKALTAQELVPVLSFVLQRGRCRGCEAPVSAWHPAIELLGLAIGVIAGALQPNWLGASYAVFGWLLLALGALDLRALWLPNLLTGALILAGAAVTLLQWAWLPDSSDPLDIVIDGLIGFGSLTLVRLGYRAVRGREGLGGGDPKLFAGIAIWLGWRMLPPVLLLACLIGLGAVLTKRLAGGRVTAADQLPLGTLLAIAGFLGWVAMELRTAL